MDSSSLPHLYADFNNLSANGIVRLNTKGTLDDLASLRITLHDGLRVVLYDGEEFVIEAVVRHCPVDGWVAEFDWDALGR